MEQATNRSYRLRGTRITAPQEAALSKFWPIYGIEYQQSPIDIDSIFSNSQRVIMEIGFGMGEATALIADNFRQDAFIAVEVHRPGIGKLLSQIQALNLENIRIIENDVHLILHYMIADKSLDGVHLYFPDPWPKKRHHKRRIVNPDFLKVIATKLRDGGFIHIATDWYPYAESIQEIFASTALFSGGVIERPNWRPVTRFEGQGITKDHVVTDLYYLKI